MLSCSVTYTAVELSDTCPATSNLAGTICTPDGEYDENNPPTADDYISPFRWDQGWKCKGLQEDDAKPDLGWILFINIFFSTFWIVPAAIGCCYCRNKSNNTAPFNGE